MADDVTVTISGNSSGLQAAAQAATESLRTFGAAVTETSQQVADSGMSAGSYADTLAALTGTMADLDDATAGNAAAIEALATSYQLASDTAAYLADAQVVLSADEFDTVQAFLAAATGAEDYATRLKMLQEQLALVREQQTETNSSGGMLAGVFGNLSSTVGGFVSQATSMFVAMAGWQVFNDAANAVRNLADELFNLEVTTEKNVNAWQYLFGSKGQASQLAQWTSQFSMQVPFTRQDLISATSTMGAMANAAQVEQFMPTLADLVSTLGATAYGGQGLTLQQGAQAVIDFMMGRSMMLKQELKINPADLLKYGMQGDVTGMGVHLSDPMSVLTALEGYSQARGLSGAASETATSTWWGEWSSFQDRVQNFLLQAGGTDLAGNIRKGSLFGDMKQQLDDLSKWMDSHSSQIARFADLISKGLGGAFGTVAKNASDFFTGVRDSGLLAGLGLAPEKHKGNASGAEMAGQGLGNFLQQLGNDAKMAAPYIKQALENLSAGWHQFTQALGPDGVQLLKDIGAAMLLMPFALVTLQIHTVAFALNVWAAVITVVKDLIRGAGDALGWLGSHIGSFLGGAGKDIADFFDGLGTKLHDISSGIGSHVGDIFSGLGTGAHNFATKVGEGFDQAKAAPGKFFDWLYHHNYYWQDLVDGAHKLVGGLKRVWDVASGDARNAWGVITRDAGAAWALVQKYVLGPAEAIWTGLTTKLGQAKDWLLHLWTQVETDASTTWNRLVTFITGIGKTIETAVQQHVITPITNEITKMVNTAKDWGKNLIDMFIQGLQQKLSDLGNAAKQAKDTVAGWLGFHSPAPNVPESASWGPNLIRMFAGGMLSEVGTVAAAARAIVGSARGSLVGTGGESISGYGSRVVGPVSSSVRYGDEQNVLHLHGVSEPAMARVTERLLRRRDRDSNIALRRPGGYHKFGAIGGRLG